MSEIVKDLHNAAPVERVWAALSSPTPRNATATPRAGICTGWGR
jgi:hypothetical protein